MSISRRQFILGTAAGLILPSYYEKILAHWENHGEPLIEVPGTPHIELIARDWGWGGIQLNWGDPEQRPPEMTLREYADRYFGGLTEYFEGECPEGTDPDELLDPFDVLDTWSYQDGPTAKAFRLLEGIDLGPGFKGGDAVGEIRFIDGVSPDNDSFWVEAADEVSLSLLQKRLNELNTGIRIQIG